MRTQKTLAVIPAIAAGIADKVLHEVGCAALMNTKRLLFMDLTRSGLPKSKFQTEAFPNFEIWKRTRLPLMSPVILRTEDRIGYPRLERVATLMHIRSTRLCVSS
jgi:hypothetical protein